MAERKERLSRMWDSLPVRTAVCVAAPLLIFAILLLTQGKSPFVAYRTIYTSIFGSVYGFGEMVVRATYLILTGLAAMIPARVGLANAGGEGQMAVAALGTAVAGSTILAQTPWYLGIPLMLLTGMICGAAYAGIGVLCRLKLGMNEILTTILMNYVATYFISSLLFGVLRDPKGWNYPQTVEVASQLRFRTYLGTRMNAGIWVAICAAALFWYLLNHTQKGFAIRTIGGNQTAAAYAGIRVKTYQTWMFLLAGALAGLAGAIMVVGVEGRMRISAGETMGFMGFLAAGMAGNHPLLLILSALLIGGLTVAGNGMEINTGLPAATMQILIMLVLLTIMAVGGKKKHD